MTHDQLKDLLELLPEGISLDGELPFPSANLTAVQKKQKQMRKFARAYANLQFGWHYVSCLADEGLSLTPQMKKAGGPVLTAAYAYLALDVYCPHVFEAWMIADAPERRVQKQTIEAALLARDFNLQQFSRITGISPRTVTTFEQLFFNILDRKHDATFLATTVYPDTRMVEMFDGYLRETAADVSRLLQRSGHNNGMQEMLYLAGYGTDALSALTAHDAPEKLEMMIMANGLLLARNGWINQRGNAAGFHNARGLITAAKMNGADNNSTNETPFASLGATFQQEMIATQRAKAKDSLSLAKPVYESEPTGAKTRDK